MASTEETAGGSVHTLELILSGVAIIAATLGLLAAWRMYAKGAKRGTSEGLHRVLYNKYYVDEIYQAVIIGPLVWLSRNILWKVVDAGAIDGTVNGIAHGAASVGDLTHTGSERLGEPEVNGLGLSRVRSRPVA